MGYEAMANRELECKVCKTTTIFEWLMLPLGGAFQVDYREEDGKWHGKTKQFDLWRCTECNTVIARERD